MDWLNNWNKALDYLEEHLEGETDPGELGRLAGCSAYHFQRMFSYLAGVPLSEYIRRRRMTRAAADLQSGRRCWRWPCVMATILPPLSTGLSRRSMEYRRPKLSAAQS